MNILIVIYINKYNYYCILYNIIVLYIYASALKWYINIYLMLQKSFQLLNSRAIVNIKGMLKTLALSEWQ